ncbi:MAG: aspartate--tRNA(Asn) ligase [bacterium]|nr:aspartate--tRNA(Asn) ligase [bacterium]
MRQISRTLSKDLKEHIGKEVTIAGWIHKKRMLGGLNFLNIRDRGGLVQVVVEDKKEVEKLRGMQIGTVVEIAGKVKSEERAPGGAEIHEPTITVITPVTDEPPIEIDKPLDHKSENFDTLFGYRPVGLRNINETNIFKIQATILKACRDYFEKNDFTEARTPKLLAEATEGGAEVFKLDYFGKEATLAQSPQFYKQILVGVFERVYEIANVYRAEPSATVRHMTEYTSIDGEMGFITLKDLEDFLSGMLNYIVDEVWKIHEQDLKKWNATKPKLTEKFPVIPLQEIHELYFKATGEDSRGEKDMRPDEEKWITEYTKKKFGSEAMFVSDWPADDMKFYHQADPKNPDVADRIDLIFRGVEITTGSMREQDYKKVKTQLVAMGGDPEDPGFKPLLMAMQAGLPPHGGFGLGLERLTQKIIGLHNIKEASLFPRDINRLAP